MEFFHTLLSFLAIISVIVFIHEFGHYAVAKLCGVKILTFSIGFGKELVGLSDRSGTRWKLSMLPFGGYVKMFGDQGAASTPDAPGLEAMSEAERKVAFHAKPLWQKALIVFAGPAANFILTIGIFTYFLSANGISNSNPVVGQVLEHSAAQEAGIMAGDWFLSIDGHKVESFSDISMQITVANKPNVSIILKRGDTIMEKVATLHQVEGKDAFGNKAQMPQLGIQSQKITLSQIGLGGALHHAIDETWKIMLTTYRVLGQFVMLERDTKDLKGPIGIAKLSGQATEGGLNMTLWFMAMLSVNLGLINLLPVPLLDGGHLMYYAIEALRGKPMAQHFQEYGFRIGFALIAMLMAFSIFNDIHRLF